MRIDINNIKKKIYRHRESMRTDDKKRRITVALVFLGFLYVVSIIGQIFHFGLGTKYDEWGYSLGSEIKWFPLTAIFRAFTPYGLKTAGSLIVVFFVLGVIYNLSDNSDIYDERGFEIDPSGLYGTARRMDRDEALTILDIAPFKDQKEIIYGLWDGEAVTLREDSRYNRMHAVVGAPGTGKSAAYVINEVFQSVRRGESIALADPKQDIQALVEPFLRENGYDVKVFNLVNPLESDSWNPLLEITRDPDNISYNATVFTSIIIKNTSGDGGGDPFWDTAEQGLLTALSLERALSDSGPKTLGYIYELLAQKSIDELDELFRPLPKTHPAKNPWMIFKDSAENSEKVASNVIQGLAQRLQLFGNPIINKITSFDDMNFYNVGQKKSAYIISFPDQNSSMEMIVSLFFTFLFNDLTRLADSQESGELPIPTNVIIDEFNNIGQLQDVERTLAMVRSRKIRISVIIQNFPQFKARYPKSWEDIFGVCDIRIFLGGNDLQTAKYFSELSGTMTVRVVSTRIQRKVLTIFKSAPEMGESHSLGKRPVYLPDEINRLSNDRLLVFFRGQNMLELDKFMYFLYHPDRDKLNPRTTARVPEYSLTAEAMAFDKKYGIKTSDATLAAFEKDMERMEKERRLRDQGIDVPFTYDDSAGSVDNHDEVETDENVVYDHEKVEKNLGRPDAITSKQYDKLDKIILNKDKKHKNYEDSVKPFSEESLESILTGKEDYDIDEDDIGFDLDEDSIGLDEDDIGFDLDDIDEDDIGLDVGADLDDSVFEDDEDIGTNVSDLFS